MTNVPTSLRLEQGRMPAPAPALRNLRFRLFHGLDLSLDIDAIADHHAAGLEDLVPRQTEVLAIDGRL